MQMRAHPFVGWVGGKQALVPEIVRLLPKFFGDYWEPFLGGGAVFFALDDHIHNVYLSDFNLELITAYVTIRKKPGAVITLLLEHAKNHSDLYYLKIRKTIFQDPIELTARFIYLNKTCYNGLYRVNKDGQFNVSIGTYKNPTICDIENIRHVSKVLRKAKIKQYSFEQITPKAGDLVYCDPPYAGGFTAYTSKGFDEQAQKSLRDHCIKWVASGVHVIISNSNTPLIRRLFGKKCGEVVFQFHKVEVSRHINRRISCQGNGRGKVTELLITSIPNER